MLDRRLHELREQFYSKLESMNRAFPQLLAKTRLLLLQVLIARARLAKQDEFAATESSQAGLLNQRYYSVSVFS